MKNSSTGGNAIVYCEGCFGTTNGKTAHGLVRLSRKYRILSVVDSRHAGRDAGEVLDGEPCGIPILDSVQEACRPGGQNDPVATHLVVGLAPDGGRLTSDARKDMATALVQGLDIVSGLHDFLGDDPWLASIAREHGLGIHDLRRPPPVKKLHFFSGKIEEVEAVRIAVLGTDSAVGKRTTAWIIVDALDRAGHKAEMVGTGQTAMLQGARYGVVMDSLVNDFVAGEIEHAMWSAWSETRAGVLIVEGQGSLMNPAYPGGFEILAAARPAAVVLQHAPARREYDGFPGYEIQTLDTQILAVELLSDKPVVAVTINHEGLSPGHARRECERITAETGLPAVDPLLHGVGPVLEALEPFLGQPGQQRQSIEKGSVSWDA